MLKTIAKFLLMIFIPLFLIFSCTKDDEVKQLNKDEAVDLLTQTSQLMGLTMDQVMETPGMNTLLYFIELNDNLSTTPLSKLYGLEEFRFFIDKSNAKPFLFKKQSQSNKEFEFDTPFGDFGTYTWNISLSNWGFEPTPADKIIYQFPADPLDESNSASVIISDIEQFEEEALVFLNKFKIIITLNQQEVFSFNYSAIFEGNKIEKISIDINLFPFTFSANQLFENLSNSAFLTTSFNLKKESVTLMSSKLEVLLNGEVDFSQVDYEYYDNIETTSVNGYVQMGSVKATLELTHSNLSDPNLSQDEIERLANKNLKIKFYVYPSGTSIAYVKWYFNQTESDIEPFIVYSDGSEENAINFVPDNILEIIEPEDETGDL